MCTKKMLLQWCTFLFLASYDMLLSNAAILKTQQMVYEPDLNGNHFTKYPRYHRGTGVLVIPDVVNSLVDVIRLSLPTISKGTRSRVGFGFAFGNHADFQVALELGPQKKTKALDDSHCQTTSSNAKRQASRKPKSHKSRIQIFKTDGDKFLQLWAQMMKDFQLRNSDKL